MARKNYSVRFVGASYEIGSFAVARTARNYAMDYVRRHGGTVRVCRTRNGKTETLWYVEAVFSRVMSISAAEWLRN